MPRAVLGRIRGLSRNSHWIYTMYRCAAAAFAGLVVIAVMAMAMYELFAYVEKHTTAWAHRGS